MNGSVPKNLYAASYYNELSCSCFPGCVQHRPKTAKLGLEARNGQETCEARTKDSRSCPYSHPSAWYLTSSLFSITHYISIGQRLASQKGQSDDILGAMNAQEKALDVEDQPSDEDEWNRFFLPYIVPAHGHGSQFFLCMWAEYYPSAVAPMQSQFRATISTNASRRGYLAFVDHTPLITRNWLEALKMAGMFLVPCTLLLQNPRRAAI